MKTNTTAKTNVENGVQILNNASATRRIALLNRILAAVLALAAWMCVAPPPLTPTPVMAQIGDASIIGAQAGSAETPFINLQVKLKNFALIVLLIMLVIAAIMAAMQKTGMAISIAIAGIVLFGGVYILLLLKEGLNG